MTIMEVQTELFVEEKNLPYEKITVSVPVDKIDEFNKWFKEWKNNLN